MNRELAGKERRHMMCNTTVPTWAVAEPISCQYLWDHRVKPLLHRKVWGRSNRVSILCGGSLAR